MEGQKRKGESLDLHTSNSANRRTANIPGPDTARDHIGHRHRRRDPPIEHDPHHIYEVDHQAPGQRHSRKFSSLFQNIKIETANKQSIIAN